MLLYLTALAAVVATVGYATSTRAYAEQNRAPAVVLPVPTPIAAENRVAVERTEAAMLRRRLAETETRLTAMRAERDAALARAEVATAREEVATAREEAALARAEAAQSDMHRIEVWLKKAVGDKVQQRTRLAAIEARLRELLDEQVFATRTEDALRWRIGVLEEQLIALRIEQQEATAWLKGWSQESVSALETLLASTGVDLTKLISRAGSDALNDGAAGGPLELLPEEEDGAFVPVPVLKPERTIGENVTRLITLHRLTQNLPLSQPLENARVTSLYGPRRDPIIGRRSMHRGLDMTAPRDTPIIAPSNGTVLRAGRNGAYGHFIELDHGLGLTTRYGHLKEVAVATGERVELGQVIGIIGNSGRSTGRHLHYEVRFDDQTLDPMPFIETGKRMSQVFPPTTPQDSDDTL